MKDLTIVIPSSGRSFDQVTLAQLTGLEAVLLAVPQKEVKDYSNLFDCLWPIPDKVKGISGTRKYLIESSPTKFLLMLDDDMTFAARDDMSSPKLRSLQPGDPGITEMIAYWYEMCHKYAHVGLSARQGNNRVFDPVTECSRMFNAYMYDVPRIKAAKPIMGRLPVMEDFDLTLQLLRKGIPNAMIYKWCWNQSGSNKKGGCSQYRTNEMQTQAALKLKEYHPDFVRVVEKESKNWEGMEKRTDVIVSWKKAYLSSKMGK